MTRAVNRIYLGGTTTNRYYNASWQEVEERIGNVAVAQNVWSQVYIDALVARDYPASVDGSLDTSFSSDGKHTEDIGTGTTDLASGSTTP